MAKKLKITKQELEQDEIALTVQTLAQKASANRSRLLVLAGAVILVVAVGYGYSSYRRQAVEEGSQTLNLANQLFTQLPTMQSEEDRTKGLTNVINSLQNLIDQRPGSRAAHAALYLKGNCHYYMDEYDQAQKAYTDYTNDATDDEDRARGVLALASAQENKFYFNPKQVNLLDEATASYEKAENLAPKGSYLQYTALLGKARILELRSRDQEAIEIYERIVKERPSPIKIVAAAPESEADGKKPLDFGEMLRNQINQSLEPFSLEAAAKMRLESLKGASQNVTRGPGKSSVESADEPTTPTASAAPTPAASAAMTTGSAPAAPAMPQIVPQNP